MALTVGAREDAALIFRAAHYFVQLGRLARAAAALGSPGELSVTHAELGDGRFLLQARHRSIRGSAG